MAKFSSNEGARPEGFPLECTTMPTLTQAHTGRLRRLWSFGRPVHVRDLTGVELDLVVHGLVETVDSLYGAGPVIVVTKRGVAHLNELRQASIEAQRPHHSLGQRLSHHLRSKGFHTWENVEFLNPVRTMDRAWAAVRPDVYSCKPTPRASASASAIYEVKVSRADYLADIAKPHKRQAYAELAEAVYYCCPAGLIEKTEAPDGFGLIYEVSVGNFKLIKNARRNKGFAMHADTAMALMLRRQVPLEEGVE